MHRRGNEEKIISTMTRTMAAVTVLLGTFVVRCLAESNDHTAENATFLTSPEQRLVQDLLAKVEAYGKVARPLRDSSKALEVEFGLRLMHLEIDEKQQTLKTSVWKRIAWEDKELLSWNKSEYGGLTHVVLPRDSVWRPDIGLVNTASTASDERPVDLQVRFDGHVFWAPQQVYNSACLIDVEMFPYDKHTCHMWFQSTSHYSSFVDLNVYYKSPLDTSTYLGEYRESAEWELLANKSARVRRPAEEGVILMYSNRVSLKFTLSVRRRPGFKAMLLTLPCVVLSLLTVVVFALSPERPDRHMLAMGLFGSFMVLLLVLTESAPPTAASVPRLGMYYGHNLLLIISSIFVSTCVVNIYKLGELKKPVPRWVRVVFFKILATPLLMRERVHHLQELRNHGDSFKAKNNGDGFMSGKPSAMQSTKPTNNIEPNDQLLTHLDNTLTQMEAAVLQMQIVPVKKESYCVAAWKLVALILDRIFMGFYLALSILLIALYYPRPS